MKLSERARLAIAVTRLHQGRLTYGRCVPATRRLRHAVGCTRASEVAAFVIPGRSGTDDLAFVERRRVAGRLLPRGRYRVSVAPTDAAGNAGLPVGARFRVG